MYKEFTIFSCVLTTNFMQVEWMCDDIAKKMTDDLNNPFNFKNLKVFPELKRIVQTPQPKVIFFFFFTKLNFL